MEKKFLTSEKVKDESFRDNRNPNDFLKEQRRREKWRGEGEAFEKYLFSFMNLDDPNTFKKEESDILGEHGGSGKFVPEYKAKQLIELIKKYQKDSAINPTSRYASDLRNKLKKNLGIEDDDRLRFYTTIAKQIKTAVDVKLGIDAFFIFIDDSGVEYRINIDATTNPDIKGVGTADIVISPENVPDYKEEVFDYKQAIEYMAQQIEMKIRQIMETSKKNKLKEQYKRPQGSLSTIGRRGRKIQEYVPEKNS